MPENKLTLKDFRNHFGEVRIPMKLLEKHPEAVIEFLSGILITRAEYFPITEEMCYAGYSRMLFRERRTRKVKIYELEFLEFENDGFEDLQIIVKS